MASSEQNNANQRTRQQTATHTSNSNVITIDVVELILVLLHYAWAIILAAVLLGGAAFAYSKYMIPEQFKSTTRIYILEKDGEKDTNSIYADLAVGSQLTKDYEQIIVSRTVIENVIAKNNLQEEYTYESFVGKVSVNTPEDTRIVEITVSDTDPELAKKFADDIRVAASRRILDTMQIDAVNTLDEANYPNGSYYPNCTKYAMMGALAGIFLVCVIIVLLYLLDDTVKTESDVEKYFKLSTLAQIPMRGKEGAHSKAKAKKQNAKSVQKDPQRNTKPLEPGRNTAANQHTESHSYRPAADSNLLISQIEEMMGQEKTGDAIEKLQGTNWHFLPDECTQSVAIKDSQLSFGMQEEYKRLRSNIVFSGKNIHTITITSCTPNEGKSEVSFELARSFARAGKRVLLVDADLRKSIMKRHFHSGKINYGLSDCLVGQCSIADCICKTDEDDFYVIFSGPIPPTPSELLISDSFDQLLEAAQNSFDYVIVDTPPLGSVIDAAIVSAKTDGTALVIAAGETSYRGIQSVIDQLTKADCRILGCVLNKIDLSNRKGYYGKYYSKKYYGKYYSSNYAENNQDENKK